MPRPLQGTIISVTGYFGENRKVADLKRWIENNGGQLSGSISATVTHLICSKTAWKAKNPIVKAAMKNQRIRLVNYDWLEDSLLEGRKIFEGPYLWETAEKRRQEKVMKEKQATRKYIEAKQPVRGFAAGSKMAQQDLHSDNYHLYQDDTSFTYLVILTRPDAFGTNIDKVALKLYETHTIRPAQYAFVATYEKHDPISFKPDIRIIVPTGSPYHIAFAAFRKMFQKMTGVEWDFRSWNNTKHLNMQAKAMTRGEGYRLHDLVLDYVDHIHDASKDFLDGDFNTLGLPTRSTQIKPSSTRGKALRHQLTAPASSHGPMNAFDPLISSKPSLGPASTHDRCYHYRLPMPSQGQPRGSENLMNIGYAVYGHARTEHQRIGGTTRARAEPNAYLDMRGDEPGNNLTTPSSKY